jgi:hypothetical protein
MKPEILWPSLNYEEWKDTLDALHMKMQVVGKIKLALNPFLNQWWNTAFYLTASGMTTGLIPYKDTTFEIDFDFIEHTLLIRIPDKEIITISINNCSVAEFYKMLMDRLSSAGIKVTINTLPSEVPNPIHCYQDTRSAHNEQYVHRWWKILLQLSVIFERFRTPFRGKSSPVHFFWGSFDLAHTRFSGKPAEPPKQGGIIMKYSENEENFSCGFWAGNDMYPKAAFYSYIYPAPKGIEGIKIKPKEASYNGAIFGEFILDYDDVRESNSPEEMILDFLNSTYEGSAKLAGWDIKSLEGPVPD